MALLGTNGAGKSTALKVIAGILTPHRGAVFYEGSDITAHDPEEIVRMDPFTPDVPFPAVADGAAEPILVVRKGGPHAAFARVLEA